MDRNSRACHPEMQPHWGHTPLVGNHGAHSPGAQGRGPGRSCPGRGPSGRSRTAGICWAPSRGPGSHCRERSPLGSSRRSRGPCWGPGCWGGRSCRRSPGSAGHPQGSQWGGFRAAAGHVLTDVTYHKKILSLGVTSWSGTFIFSGHWVCQLQSA